MDSRALALVVAAFGGAAYLALRARVSAPVNAGSGDALAGASLAPLLPDTTGQTLLSQIHNLGGYAAPRGIRNNNAGNIRKDGTQWQGLAPPDQQTDPDFYVFTEGAWGLRAIARIMLNKQRRGLASVRQLISGPGGWAPETVDDNPSGYADFVAGAMGVDPDQPIDLANDRNALDGLVAAIVQFENGQQPYDSTYIDAAVNQA